MVIGELPFLHNLQTLGGHTVPSEIDGRELSSSPHRLDTGDGGDPLLEVLEEGADCRPVVLLPRKREAHAHYFVGLESGVHRVETDDGAHQ